MTATLTFHPLGNADCTRIDFANGQKMLVDYADMRNANDPFDKRVDLPDVLKADLRVAKRDNYDVVCFTHLDDDHCCGAGDFFWLDHAAKYQGEGRIKIKELWVPAAAILEDGCQDSARIIRQEARHRLRQGYGIRVFSRPKKLKDWLEKQGLSLEARAHLITDAGTYVPGYSKYGQEQVEFFIHSPFGWRQDDNGIIDRNQDSVVFQATFLENGRETYALFMSDIDCDSIDQMVKTTKRHGNEDRLLWDIFKIPHHCSYTAIGWEKGEDKTQPTEDVEWLCETQGRERHVMVSTSKPMPVKGSAEDKDVQPPHRQAGAYYKSVAREADGSFKVTMETPSIAKPKPIQIEITDRGARLLTISAIAGAASIVSAPARAG
ncbi:hypothetical protein [Sulfitobacter sp.]|uniref:hypothetical protein n=1 Tax=Sulfitobacter sp. TaxID=1903071 RepID=UPI0025D495EE|nr:hypothetical protein [Sulfitobacter sp.]